MLASSGDGRAEVEAGTGDEARDERSARPSGSDGAVRAEKSLRGAGAGGDSQERGRGHGSIFIGVKKKKEKEKKY